jgi:hypothetical protein
VDVEPVSGAVIKQPIKKEIAMIRGTRILTGTEAARYVALADRLRRLLHRRRV